MNLNHFAFKKLNYLKFLKDEQLKNLSLITRFLAIRAHF